MPLRQVMVPETGDFYAQYDVPQAQQLHVQAVTAVFDGFGAASAFRPVLDIYSAAGTLVSRSFPSRDVPAGEQAEVTWHPFSGAAADGGSDTGVGIYATSPQPIPILEAETGSFYGNGFGLVRVDPTVRMNAVRTNQSPTHTAAVNDYFTHMVTLGPRGSCWGFNACWKAQPAGGWFKVGMASVASPNPARVALDPTSYLPGSLDDDITSWIEWAGVENTYDPVAQDSGWGQQFFPFRIMGEDGAPFTTITPNGDPFTGFNTIDGGSGVYSVRIRVDGKSPASTGYRVELTSLTLVRLDDVGNM